MPHRHRHHLRLLTYDAALVPEGGAAVYAQATAFTLSYGKEPAGHFFHLFALKQAGLYGALWGEDASGGSGGGGSGVVLYARD